jgi:hypothetical protein
MLRLVSHSGLRVPPPARVATVPDQPEGAERLEHVLEFAMPIAGSHALIVSRNGIDLMCALLRHGCAEAAEIHFDGKPDAGQSDLVIFPDLTGADSPARICHLAQRALVPTGRLIACVSGRSSRAASLALARELRGSGFVAPHGALHEDRTYLRVELPAFGGALAH